MKTILVTGGAGFIGSHVSEYFAQKGWHVIVFDNLSRALLLKNKCIDPAFNWNYLQERYAHTMDFIKADVNDRPFLKKILPQCDVIIHTAGQTAVTRSIEVPEEDFINNALATLNLLEESRLSGKKHKIVFCSTNKVYGEKANTLSLIEKDTRYAFNGHYGDGIDEDFGIDLCKHSPYGCSKIASDMYCQEYAKQYGLDIGIFRMSCIYGPRQLGIEDQGWIAWFVIALLMGQKITIYGNGKQVRDVLYVDDLVKSFDAFISSSISYGLYNTGGGINNTVSLMEVLLFLEKECGLKADVTYKDWRPSDQKVFYTNIEKIKRELGWAPTVHYQEGIKQLVTWCRKHQNFMDRYNGKI